MTLAQSPLRQLSGSKFGLIAVLILLVSCSSTKNSHSSSSARIIKPNTNTTVTSPTKVSLAPPDTMLLTLIADEKSMPIASSDFRQSISTTLSQAKKSVYNVALLMPFRGSTLDENNMKFANFYGGLQLAAAESADVIIRMRTYSTERSEGSIRKILNDFDSWSPDLIVGPFETEHLQSIADYGKKNRIPVISPWKSSTQITNDNPYFLQIRPNITDYYANIVQHINANFDRSQVCIIGRPGNQDLSKNRAIQRLNQELSNLPLVQAYREFSVSIDSLLQTDTTVFVKELDAGVKAFIVPHYVIRDESYVYSCLRKLYAEKGESEFYVYTMPTAIGTEDLDLNIFKQLKLRTCEFKFVDKRNPQVKRIREKFFNQYGSLPDSDAYYGYDLMQYIKKGLAEEGQYFYYYLKNRTLEFSQMSLKVKEVVNANDRTDYFVNSHMYLIEFINDTFVARSLAE